MTSSGGSSETWCDVADGALIIVPARPEVRTLLRAAPYTPDLLVAGVMIKAGWRFAIITSNQPFADWDRIFPDQIDVIYARSLALALCRDGFLVPAAQLCYSSTALATRISASSLTNKFTH